MRRLTPTKAFRFVLSVAVLLAVLSIAYTLFAVANENQARGRRSEQILHLLQAQRADDKAERAATNAARLKAQNERGRLLDLVNDSEERQRALLAYLRKQGIALPPGLGQRETNRNTSSPAPSSAAQGPAPTQRTTTTPTRSQPPSAPRGTTPQPASPTPAPTRPTPTPDPPKGLVGQLLGDLL